MQRDRIEGTAEDVACCERILRLYPWQVFDFRVGAWVRVPRATRTLLTRERMRWITSGKTPMQLLVNGKPIVDLEAIWPGMPSIGTMLFAGDTHVGGACWDMTFPGRKINFSHPLSLDRDTARAEAMAMTPGGAHSEVVLAAIRRETISQHLWLPDARQRTTTTTTGSGPEWLERRIRRALAGAIVRNPRLEVVGRRNR